MCVHVDVLLLTPPSVVILCTQHGVIFDFAIKIMELRSKVPSSVVLRRISGQLLLCVRAADPEELCVHACACVRVRALVYTSAATKHIFPSHSTPLSQPLSHSLVLFNKDFSAAPVILLCFPLMHAPKLAHHSP